MTHEEVNTILAQLIATGDAVTQAAYIDAVKEIADQTEGFTGWYPEMGEKAPVAHIEATLSHYGRHYFLKTPLTLKKARGIEPLGKLTEGRLVKGSRYVGWNEYKVTTKALAKLEETLIVSHSMLL